MGGDPAAHRCLACAGAGCSLCRPDAEDEVSALQRMQRQLEREEETAAGLRLQLQRKSSVSTECADAWDMDFQELHAENGRLTEAVRELARENIALHESVRDLKQEAAEAGRPARVKKAERVTLSSAARNTDDILQNELLDAKAHAWELQEECDKMKREATDLRYDVSSLQAECAQHREFGEAEHASARSLQDQVDFLEDALEAKGMSGPFNRSRKHQLRGVPRPGGGPGFLDDELDGAGTGEEKALRRELRMLRKQLGDMEALRAEVKALRGRLASAEEQLGVDRPYKHRDALLRTVKELRRENCQLREEAASAVAVERQARKGVEWELVQTLAAIRSINCMEQC